MSTGLAERPRARHAAEDARPHAVVIGSGFGGLAAAVRLGARGYRVTVLERLDKPGGRAYVHEQDGFTFDAGPTIITAPFVFEELWSLCGRKLSDDVTLKRLDLAYRILFDDGERFDCLDGEAAQRAEVARISLSDLPGYDRFMAKSEGIYRAAFEGLAHVPFDTLFDMAKAAPALLRHGGLRSVHATAAACVKDERLRIALSFHPLFVGGSPFSTSAAYCLISYLERFAGVHFAMGGTGALVKGLVRLIESQGGRVRCGADVAEILHEGGRARGARLADGERIAAEVVVSNADPAWTYARMLPGLRRRRWTDAKIARQRYSMSLFVWYFGTNRPYQDVPHHTILLGPRYRGLLDDIFDRKVLADDFSLYLHRPTATDPSLAPPGCDAFYALSPVPHLDARVDWETEAEAYRAKIEARLEERLLPGLRGSIATSRVTTPLDFEARLKSWKGAAFGPAPVLLQSAWFRPHNRSEELDRLYFVGAGTHPGPAFRASSLRPRSWTPSFPMPQNSADYRDAADRAACADAIRVGSRSFHAASKLLPARVREPALALYAFCRVSDDLVDEGSDPRAATSELLARLRRVYDGRPEDRAADRAFAGVVRRYAMPRALPEALIEGFEWDADGRRYETLSDLRAYAARVAGSVGAMMAVLMGVRDPARLARACDLGVAMQLTNVARDVGEDARKGRLYLPLAWMREEGLDADGFLADPRFSPALGRVVARLLHKADALYARADSGIAGLPFGCRPSIFAASRVYRGIGRAVARAGYDSVAARARVGDAAKTLMIAQAAATAVLPNAAGLDAPPLPETRFLVAAVSRPEAEPKPPGRTERFIDLLIEWERRRRATAAGAVLERLRPDPEPAPHRPALAFARVRRASTSGYR